MASTFSGKVTNTASGSSELLTRDQAADYLSMKPQTLANWACTGRESIPLIKMGSRMVRYRKSDLDAWLAARTVGTVEE